MKLHALLIGIDDYPYAPLRQCKYDISKVESYLESLADQFEESNIVKLLDGQASKANVVHAIKEVLGNAGSEDVALMYYSGHGGQEETSGLFTEEYDGLMECLVCHYDEDQNSGFLLADKELRFLFSQFTNDPHLITIFDCCHSGDMVRAFTKGPENDAIRRLSDPFTRRSYDEFIFHDYVRQEEIQTDGFSAVAPYKNHIHIAACLDSESSWEDAFGGVFTRYLLQLLNANNHNLAYVDIARWAKISIKDVTAKKQTPVINVQGDGNLSAYSKWLNLSMPEIDNKGKLIYNVNLGWILNRGSLMGIKEGTSVQINLGDGKQAEGIIGKVDLEDASVSIANANQLDTNKAYDVTSDQVLSQLRIYVNDLDGDDETSASLLNSLKENNQIIVGQEGDADFYVNIFNRMVYFSLPDSEFTPLARQLDLVDEHVDISDFLNSQLPKFIKWNHFYSLENPSRDFDEPPLLVQIQKEGSEEWIDVANGKIRLDTTKSRSGDKQLFYFRYRIRVINNTIEDLYVGVLTLNSDMSITSYPWQNKVVRLEPGKPRYFYDHRAEPFNCVASIDAYKEVYNWDCEWFNYKFIINNFEDFTNLIEGDTMRQGALPSPLLIEDFEDKSRGEGIDESQILGKKKWGCMITRIELENPEYNIASGTLLDKWEAYSNSEQLAPFIQMAYFTPELEGTQVTLNAKQNQNESAEMASKATSNRIVIFANALFNIIRKRRFKKQKHNTGPIVVAEGDSWFLFPLPGVKDTIDYISKKYRVRSLADAGDEVEDYFKEGDLLAHVEKLNPEYVLISGGGNDIVGEKIQDILISDVQNGNKPEDYINGQFQEKMDRLKELYTFFFNEIEKINPDTKILIHGYDYIRHDPDKKTIKKGWANRYMIQAGIHDPEMRKRIIHYLVDTFNDILVTFDDAFEFVSYIDHRGTVATNEWRDEIHPNNVGYKKVADNFLQRMN